MVALDLCILLIPPAVEGLAVCPSVRGEEISCIAAAEIGVHRCRELRLFAAYSLFRVQNCAFQNGKVSCINDAVAVLIHILRHARRRFAEQYVGQHHGVAAVCRTVTVQVCIHPCKRGTRQDAGCQQQSAGCSHDPKTFFHPKSSLVDRKSLIAAFSSEAFFQYSTLVCKEISKIKLFCQIGIAFFCFIRYNKNGVCIWILSKS